MAKSNQYSSRSKAAKNQNTPEVVVVEAILRGVVFVFSALFRLIFKRGQGSGRTGLAYFEQQRQIRENWEQVEFHLAQENSQVLAVSEADKLLDVALQLKKLPGQNMGERLKAARGSFPPDLYQGIWDAHKLRNTLAHEMGAKASPVEIRQAVHSFRQALYHLQIL